MESAQPEQRTKLIDAVHAAWPHIKAALDQGRYENGVKVSDQQFATINLNPQSFHGDWNYKIGPSSRK